MKLKKLTAVLLAAVTVCGMTVCSVSAESEAKTIQFMWGETDAIQADVVQNYIKPALEENFPDIQFEFVGINTSNDSPIKILSATGDLPEIFITVGKDMTAVLGAGDALDLSPYLDEAWLTENYTYPQKLYNGDAIYFLYPGQNGFYSPVFYYNTALFEEHGIEIPNNMDEFVAACQTFIDAGIIPMTMAQFTSSYSLVDGIIASADPEAFKGLNSRTANWTDDNVKEAMGYFDQLKTMGAFAPDIINKDDATAYAEFQSGNTAMLYTFSWHNAEMVEEKLGFEAGCFSWPNSGEDYIQLIWECRDGFGGGYAANANYEDPELLVEILKVAAAAESSRYSKNGVTTNFITNIPVEPANELEATRLADYDRAESQISVLCQAQMDSPTIAEYVTLYNMLMSDDKDYLSENFLEEFQPYWEANTYGPTE